MHKQNTRRHFPFLQ